MAMAIRTEPTERKSTAMGLFQALYGIGMTIGPVLMGYLVELKDYKAAYFVFSAFASAAMLLSLVLLPWLAAKTANR